MQNKSFRAPVTVEALEGRRLLTVIAGFSESLVASGMTRPVQMSFAPDGRLFVTQQDGKLRVIKNGTLLSSPFLTVPTHNAGERGLLGITFDPDFANNQFLYVYYTHPEGNGVYRNRVSRFTANGDTAVAGSETVLIETDPLGAGSWHNAGGMEFGPDGKLYVGIGDNQQTVVAQDMDTLLGKVIRINADGSIPTDNPFYDSVPGKYRAIWALGFRNPFTMDVQPGTGRIFVNDVGAANWEEINELQKGANYGWPGSEGATTHPAYTNPFYTYAHTGGDADNSAITGAAFYNPQTATFPAEYLGDFFFGDYGTGNIKRIDLDTKVVSGFVNGATEITDVEIAPDGALYYTSRAAGRIYRVQANASSKPTITVPPQEQTVAVGRPATFSITAAGAGLSYQWQRNGVDIPNARSASYTLNPTTLEDNDDAFRVIVSNTSGSVTSAAATLEVLDDQAPTATITLPTDGTLWKGGGSISFAGTGADPEEGDLPASAFTWEIVAHHDTHTHPFIAPYSGVKSDTIQISTIGETEPNIWYRVHLTVRDSFGLESSTFKDVYPQKSNLSVVTEPAGLRIDLDGSPLQTPHATPAVVGLKRNLSAPATQVLNGVVYTFDGWSDGGASAHDILVPETDTLYTARYKVSTQQTATLRPTGDAHVRDGIYANTNYGSQAQMEIKNDGIDRNRHGYLSFDLSQIGTDISSAKLRIYGSLGNTLSSTVGVSVYGAPTGWFESVITWNNKPASNPTAIGAFTVNSIAGKFYEIDLTATVKQQKSFGATSLGLVLKAAASKAGVFFASDEAAANQPQLIVETGGGSTNPDPDPTPVPTALRSVADSFVRSGSYASTNYGSASELMVKTHSSTGYTRTAYLQFDLTHLASVSSATLRLYGRLSERATLQTAVYVAPNSNWTEGGINWNNRPIASGAGVTKTITSTASAWYEWNLTSLLQAEKAAGRNVVTLVIQNLNQSNAAFMFSSDEAPGNRPELVVGQ